MSGSGRRSAICTLFALLSFPTSGEPFCFRAALSEDRCLRKSRPSGLAHHFASWSSFVNFGTWLIRFIASLSSCTMLQVSALLSCIQITGGDHSDLAVAPGYDHRDETAPLRLSVVHVAHLTAGAVSYTHLRAHETRHDLVC